MYVVSELCFSTTLEHCGALNSYYTQVREKMSKITSRLEKLNHEFEIERCELQKDVEFWTNRGKEMMDTLRFEMSELREMMRLCSSSEGVATVPFDERTE